MVREGRMAKVITCREAEVKSPVTGHPRTPVKGTVADGTATSCRVREIGEIPAVPVREGGQQGSISRVSIQKAPLAAVQEASPAPITGKRPKKTTLRSIDKKMFSAGNRQPVRADSGLTLGQLFSGSNICDNEAE